MKIKRLFPIAAAVLLLLNACTPMPAAPSPTISPVPVAASAAEASSELPDLNVPEHSALFEPVLVFCGSSPLCRGYRLGSSTWIPLEAITTLLGLSPTLRGDENAFSVSGQGLEMSGTAGSSYILVNSRYYYTPVSFLIIDGRLCFPTDALEAVFSAQWSDGSAADELQLQPESVRFPEGGELWYDSHYSYEDFYWLAHVISAESRYEPLAGQIGVGNVVLNRVRDPGFPSTIRAVVFDAQYGVQFEPAGDGSIHSTPDDISVIAAKLCLDGWSTAGDSLYFVNPERGDDTWFRSSLDYVMTIGHHDFYTQRRTDHG